MLRSIGRWRALAPALVGLALVAGTFVVVPPPPVAAAANAWKAPIGSGGKNGSVTIRVLSSGTARVIFELGGLAVSSTLPTTISRGTCAKAGATLAKGVSIGTTVAGTVADYATLSKSLLATFRSATKGSGKAAIRIGTKASGVACGVFAAWTPPATVALPVAVVTDWFTFSLPDGWTQDPATPGLWLGPGARRIGYSATGPVYDLVDLDDAVVIGLAGWATSGFGTPTRKEGIMVGERPAILLTYSVVKEGFSFYILDALIAGDDGPVIELTFMDLAGTASADRALFVSSLASFDRVETPVPPAP